MFPMEQLKRWFGELLDRLDALADAADGEAAEALEEMNAEFEDALFMLSEIDPRGEDAAEELGGALEEFDALCADYRRRAGRVPGIGECAERLAALIGMAKSGTDM